MRNFKSSPRGQDARSYPNQQSKTAKCLFWSHPKAAQTQYTFADHHKDPSSESSHFDNGKVLKMEKTVLINTHVFASQLNYHECLRSEWSHTLQYNTLSAAQRSIAFSNRKKKKEGKKKFKFTNVNKVLHPFDQWIWGIWCYQLSFASLWKFI